MPCFFRPLLIVGALALSACDSEILAPLGGAGGSGGLNQAGAGASGAGASGAGASGAGASGAGAAGAGGNGGAGGSGGSGGSNVGGAGGNDVGGSGGDGGGGGPTGIALGDLVADFHLTDVNPNSPTSGQSVSPRDYLEKVSGWYFGHST
jgi:hypothetical protein